MSSKKEKLKEIYKQIKEEKKNQGLTIPAKSKGGDIVVLNFKEDRFIKIIKPHEYEKIDMFISYMEGKSSMMKGRRLIYELVVLDDNLDIKFRNEKVINKNKK